MRGVASGAGKRKLPLFTPTPVPALATSVRDVDRAERPIYAVWEVTLACDQSCLHCGSRAARRRPNELSTEECLKVIGELADLGVQEVTLIGGEVYLRGDWLVLLAAIRDHGMEPTLVTGGLGFTAQHAEAAASAGLVRAAVSIDGEPEAHDHLRGARGSHAAAIDTLDHLGRAGVTLTVNTQINARTMPDLDATLDRIAARGVVAWQLQLTVPMGRAVEQPELLLQPFELLDLFPRLGSLAERAAAQGVSVVPGNNIGYFGPFEAILRRGMLDGHGGSCGAGKLTIGIESDGTVKGCPSLDSRTWSGGNVRAASLRDIWERGPALRYTRDRTVRDLWGFCATCYYADECRAGCTWVSDAFFRRPGNNPWCHHRALEMKAAGKRERLVLVEGAPNLPFDRGRWELVEEPLPDPGQERAS